MNIAGVFSYIKKLYEKVKEYLQKKEAKEGYPLVEKAYLNTCKKEIPGYKILYFERGNKLKRIFMGIAYKTDIKVLQDIVNPGKKDKLISMIIKNKILEVVTNSGRDSEYDLISFYNRFYEDFCCELQQVVLNNQFAKDKANYESNEKLLQTTDETNQKVSLIYDELKLKVEGLSINDQEIKHEKNIMVRSYTKYTKEFLDTCEKSKDLSMYFNGRIPLNDEVWNEIKLELNDFVNLLNNDDTYCLEISAHYSIAYYLGLLLNSKSGKKVVVNQRVATGGSEKWQAIKRENKTYDKFVINEKFMNKTSNDIAICISATNDIFNHVCEYIKATKMSLQKAINFSMNNTGNLSVQNGEHAWQLAEQIKNELNKRTIEQRNGNIHFFIAAPGGLIFFLGQMSFPFKNIHLYEFSNSNNPKDVYYKTFYIEKGEL